MTVNDRSDMLLLLRMSCCRCICQELHCFYLENGYKELLSSTKRIGLDKCLRPIFLDSQNLIFVIIMCPEDHKCLTLLEGHRKSSANLFVSFPFCF